RNDQLVGFSSYSPTHVALAAPGQAILTTAPGNSYDVVSGTSLSTPFVAGALALVWSVHPDWSYTQIIDQLLKTVDPLPVLKGKTLTGGRLNLAAAVGSTHQLPPRVSVTPRVVSSSVSGPVANSISTIRVTFNEQIEVGSFGLQFVTF